MLIEQSIATQYGILPSAQGELAHEEWSKLVSGLLDDTPLGRVVAVRAESDRKTIAQMSPWQRKIRDDWAAFLATRRPKRSREELSAQMAELERMIAQAFGGGKHG